MCEGKTENRNERNIMILFLSNLHGEWVDKANKKFGWSSKEKPYLIYNQKTVKCRETNEAPLKDILEFLKTDEVEHRYLDAVFCFATNRVRNCDKDGNEQSAITVKKMENKDVQDELDGMEWTSASDEEFFWEKRAQNITGLKFRKAEKIEDIEAVPEDTVWRISVPFNEVEGGPVNSAIKSVTAMETAIKAYLKHEGVPLTKCNIYADTTGGFRPANMAMSAVMQLLGYQEAKLRRVVYSDGKRVSNVQPIDDMYRLVAGVDAFTKYGSSAALNEYFADVINGGYPPLKKMLLAMDKFSASVLLCQTNLIKKNLKKLMRRLNKFMKEKTGERPAKVELFTRMTKDLKLRYSKMLPDMTPEPDEIEIIQWCTDNSLIQQALTLCTEWLPEYLTNHGAIYTDVLDVQSYCMALEEDKDADGKKYLLMKFLGKPPGEKTMKKIYAHATRRVIQGLIAPHLAVCQGKAEMPQSVIMRLEKEARDVLPEDFLNNFMILLKNGSTDFKKMKKGKPVKNQLLRTVVNKIIDTENNNREQQAKGRPFHEFTISDLTEDMIWEKLDGWCSDLQIYYNILGLAHPPRSYRFGATESAVVASALGKAQGGDILWEGKISKGAVKISRKMLAGHMLQSDLPMDEALEYIRGYTYIRADLRNKINHASKEAVKIDLQKVRSDIDAYLILLRKLRGRKHMHTGLWAENIKEASK